MINNLPKRFQNRYDYLFNEEEHIRNLKEQLKRTSPCTHPGCYQHISHPCEGCNRFQGELIESEKVRIRAIIKELEFPEVKYTKYNKFEIMDI